jgi:cytoskeletal protein RodZ
MSFILDALKKLERQKQGDGSTNQDDQTVMQGGRQWGEARRLGFMGWGSIIVAVAALVVAAVALYRSQRSAPQSLPQSEPLPASTSPAIEPSQGTSPSVESSPSASKDSSVAEETAKISESERASEPMTTTVQAPPQANPIDGQVALSAEPVEEAEVEPLEEEIESAHPVRLTGRHATERKETNLSDDAPGSPNQEVPEGLPELVLQGTSIVEGKPVAVVNYQRLFEGDFIEGARVIKISDSLVELEFKGKRFTISF